MTGFNHYSNCTCGWCVFNGRSRAKIADYNANFRVRDAQRLLSDRGAFSTSGCFVNPNARCPVCRKTVYFYANAAGSRVFFNDLGPPWPKHECTINSRNDHDFRGKSATPPSHRLKGEIKELLAAATIAGLAPPQIFGQRRIGEWHLAIILDVERRGNLNKVECEFVNSDRHEVFRFQCLSDRPYFAAGELISVKGDEISYVDPESLSPIYFQSGDRVPPMVTAAADASTQKKPRELDPKSLYPGLSEWFSRGQYAEKAYVEPNGVSEPIKKKKKTKKKKAKSNVAIQSKNNGNQSKHNSKDPAYEALHITKDINNMISTLKFAGFTSNSEIAKYLNKINMRNHAGEDWTPDMISKFLST